MDFDKRLERAISRGHQARDSEGRQRAEKEVSEEDFRNIHSRCRLDLTEHIESCLRKLDDHFPGFRFETIVDEDGWGARISRDDFRGRRGREAANEYSRFEMVIRPFGTARIVELAAKATVRNREIFNRTHYQFLSQIQLDAFNETIDLWVLEFAELYAANE